VGITARVEVVRLDTWMHVEDERVATEAIVGVATQVEARRMCCR
jgi:hypothetical protein